MKARPPRLAARALILKSGRLLLVNAFPVERSDLWCAPGGGVEPGHSLPENLTREVREETGLDISVGPIALVNEFHDPKSGFHQVELFFRCTIENGEIDSDWQDPERIVTRRRFFARDDLERIRYRPLSLGRVAFDARAAVHYDPLETIVL